MGAVDPFGKWLIGFSRDRTAFEACGPVASSPGGTLLSHPHSHRILPIVSPWLLVFGAILAADAHSAGLAPTARSTHGQELPLFDPASGWSPSDVIGDGGPGYDGRMVDVALDPAGNGLAVWTTGPRTAGVDVVPRVDAARFRDGVWLASETLAVGEPGYRALEPNVVLDRQGEGLVAWSLQWEGDFEFDSEIGARTYTPEAGFGPIESLDTADDYTSRLELAMNAAGIGVAVWGWGVSDVARARLFR